MQIQPSFLINTYIRNHGWLTDSCSLPPTRSPQENNENAKKQIKLIPNNFFLFTKV